MNIRCGKDFCSKAKSWSQSECSFHRSNIPGKQLAAADISLGDIGMTVLRPIHAGVGNRTEKRRKKKTSHVQVSKKNDSPRRVTPLPPFKMTIYRKRIT